jgi:hypothetical protein
MFKSNSKLDESSTMFFKIGHNPVYSESILVYIYREEKQNITYWSPVDDPNDVVYRSLYLPENVATLLSGEVLNIINTVGRFVILGHKWGFLLDLEASNDLYEGKITENWRKILLQPFF